MTTIRHGGRCGLRSEMRSAERGSKTVVFIVPGDRWYHAPPSEGGGMGHDFSLRFTTATFVYLPHSAVVSQFETAFLRPRGRMMAGTRATPPKSGGSLSSSFIPAGRLGTDPLSPRASSFQIGPRRQGFATPLRALDCCGPIRKTRRARLPPRLPTRSLPWPLSRQNSYCSKN